MKKIGIVTVTYNGADVLGPFLECLFKQSHSNFILYVIDNVSADNSVQIIKEQEDDRIKLICNQENTGVAAGNNQGINAALEDSCDYVWLLNNDVEFEVDCLKKMVDILDEGKYGLVTHKMLYYYDKSLLWYAGSHFNKMKGHIPGHRGLKSKDEGQYDKVEIVDYAPTCSILFKREVFQDVGIMDEQYFAYFDDTDFLYRVYKNGKHKMLYLPDVEFYHKVGAATKSKTGTIQKFKFGDFHIRLSVRNRVYYLRKQKSLISTLNVLYFYFWINLRFVLTGKYRRNFSTWRLIQRSFLQGLSMKLPVK